MTGEDGLREELEALERAAPADLPPRPSSTRIPGWRNIVGPAAVILGTVLIAAVVVPGLIESIRPMSSPPATGSAGLATPTGSVVPSSPREFPSIGPYEPWRCDSPPVGVSSTLTCEAAIDAASAVLPADVEPMRSPIEYHFGHYCPETAFCVFPTRDIGYVVFHTTADGPDRDLWVTVEADGQGVVTVTSGPAPFPPDSTTPGPQAEAEITFVGRWADCCYIEGAVTFASLSGGPTSRLDSEIADIETWRIGPGGYELTLYQRPCDASCDYLDPVAGSCTTEFTIRPYEGLLVDVTWHIGGPCEIHVAPRPAAPNDPVSVRGTLAIDGSCVIVTDEYAYRWAIRLPAGYRVDRTSGSATALFGPDNRIAAMVVDTVTVDGRRTDTRDAGCTTGMPFVATSLDVDAAPLPYQAVSCEPPPIGAPPALDCDRAISAAIGAWPGDRTTITYFEFYYGAHCPGWARCAAVPKRFDIGWVVLRTEVSADGSEKDVFVSVTADEGGVVTVTGIDSPPTS